MLRYLHGRGQDVAQLMACIEDAVIKAILAVREPIASCTDSLHVCRELYG